MLQIYNLPEPSSDKGSMLPGTQKLRQSRLCFPPCNIKAQQLKKARPNPAKTETY